MGIDVESRFYEKLLGFINGSERLSVDRLYGQISSYGQVTSSLSGAELLLTVPFCLQTCSKRVHYS